MRKLPKGQTAILLLTVLIPMLGLAIWAVIGGHRYQASHPGETSGHGPDPARMTMPVKVDPTVELFSVLYRLADINQYNEMELPQYVAEVEEYFGPKRNHRAVKTVKELNRTHAINGNAPMDLSIRLTAPPQLGLRTSVASALEDMDSRWDADIIPVLLDAVRAFAVEADFMAFYRAHQPFYDRAVQNLQSTLAGPDLVPWFEEFFGGKPESFVVILGLLNGSCNYGSRVTHPDGKMEFVSMLGALDPDRAGAPRYAPSTFLPTIVHEFSHSYINPLVDRHSDVLRPSGEVIFENLQKRMQYWGYNHWYVMYYEYLVRASTIRFLEAHEGAASASRRVRQDEGGGFPGVGDLAGLLTEYESGREHYPDLDSFMPRIVEFFEEMKSGFL